MRLAVVALLLTFAGPAWAKKVDSVQRLLDSGRCADAVAKVDDWEAHDALGNEDPDLRKLRADAAYCVAKKADTVAAYSAYLARFSDWPDAPAARTRMWDLAFAAAQAEGTPAAMKAFIATYPQSPYRDQAEKQEEAWAFDDAARAGSKQAIEAFLASHPDSPMREAAWESVIQATSGIYLIAGGGEPRRLDAIPVEGDTLALPAGLPSGEPVPLVGVNLPGVGRGETSDWWTLEAISFDAEGVPRLVHTAPLGARLAQRLGVPAPGPEAGLLRLIVAGGTHVARVATTQSPLALAQDCREFSRFAFVLRTPGVATQAFPFAVTCPSEDQGESAIGVLFSMLDAADGGDRITARQRWGAFQGRADGAELRAWLGAALGSDPYKAMVDDRPAVGDWVVWTTQADGTLLSSWLRPEDSGSRVLGVRPGWAVIASGALRTTVGDPACATLFGSIGATLFCTDTAPHVVSLDGSSLVVPAPPAEALVAGGFPGNTGMDKVIAAGPRWVNGQLGVTWRVRTRVQADVTAPAPPEWVGALDAPPGVGRWIQETAGSAPFGAARVSENAAEVYKAFLTR